jgi:MFS family permease
VTIDGDGASVAAAGAPRQRTPAESSLWRHRDFGYFWGGQTVSMIGSAISFIALPLVAVSVLHVNPIGMSLLAAVERLPPLLVGPFVGPLVDHRARRPLLLTADIGRAVLLGWIPFAAALGVLALWQLIVVAFGVGLLTLLFNVAYQAFLPNVVPTARLADGNGKLSASQSVAEVTGPGLASWFIFAGGPAVAVAADAVSYLVSALCVMRMRARDAVHSTVRLGGWSAFWAATRSGFPLLWRDRILRSVTLANAVLAFFAQLQAAVYFLYLARTLHLSPTAIGLVFTASGVIGFAAALGAGRLAERLGLGRLIVVGQLVLIAGGALLAAASGPRLVAAGFIVAGEACFSAGMAIFGVGYTTMFQIRTTDAVRGRVLGAAKFLSAALIPVAALAGGAVAEAYGLRTAEIVGAIGMASGLVAVLRRPVIAASLHERVGAELSGVDVTGFGLAGPTAPAE